MLTGLKLPPATFTHNSLVTLKPILDSPIKLGKNTFAKCIRLMFNIR